MATPAAILNGAYMELLQWDTSKIFPETLVLDQSRFLDLREQTQHLTLVTSVLLVTYNTVGQSIAGVQSLKVKLKEEICTLLEGVEDGNLESVLENISEQVNKNVEVFLKEHGFPAHDETQQKTLKGQITTLKEKDNQIITLMSKRVLDFIQQALFSKLTEPLKVPAGTSVMEKELSQICGQFLRLISHNRSVFGQYYANIIGTLLKRLQEDLSPADAVS
ncbi:T-complex protein 11-like protein 2 [Mercenaria mercenaria]|uniref:T-complex protein 11-like protein 2 n=1 Tax=Mercenaria mercenaria TaxID=6596 RepID=UPI00234F2262|nr:T-complex protein 11-like protein 2 [Mercenaria mercenaria]